MKKEDYKGTISTLQSFTKQMKERFLLDWLLSLFELEIFFNGWFPWKWWNQTSGTKSYVSLIQVLPPFICLSSSISITSKYSCELTLSYFTKWYQQSSTLKSVFVVLRQDTLIGNKGSKFHKQMKQADGKGTRSPSQSFTKQTQEMFFLVCISPFF